MIIFIVGLKSIENKAYYVAEKQVFSKKPDKQRVCNEKDI